MDTIKVQAGPTQYSRGRYNTPRSYAEWKFVYDARVQRSRTKVSGCKAVRLVGYLQIPDEEGTPRIRPIGLRNTTLREESNGDLVFRLYKTDLVVMRPDNTVTLYGANCLTRTTVDRLFRIAGVSIYEASPTRYRVNNTQRIRLLEECRRMTADGKKQLGNWWVATGTVPFLDGFTYNATTGVVDGTTISKLPTDRRAFYRTPTKEARRAFTALWKEAKESVLLSSAIGEIQSYEKRENNGWRSLLWDYDSALSFNTWARNPYTVSQQGKGEFLEAFLHTFMRHLTAYAKRSQYYMAKEGKLSTHELVVSELPRFRHTVSKWYHQHRDEMGAKGGQLMPMGWYIREEDKP